MCKKMLILVLAFSFAVPSYAKTSRTPAAVSVPSRYLGGVGMGLIFDPTLFLLAPQLEYLHSTRFHYGGLVQLGLGDVVLGTASGLVRYLFTIRDPRWKPSVEGAFGIAFASGSGDNVGVHIMFGGGIEYQIDRDWSLGTTIRFNFAPPMDTFFVSWPLLVARLYI